MRCTVDLSVSIQFSPEVGARRLESPASSSLYVCFGGSVIESVYDAVRT